MLSPLLQHDVDQVGAFVPWPAFGFWQKASPDRLARERSVTAGMLSPLDSSWMGDRLGTPGAVGFFFFNFLFLNFLFLPFSFLSFFLSFFLSHQATSSLAFSNLP
jgi:hypothetical protein